MQDQPRTSISKRAHIKPHVLSACGAGARWQIAQPFDAVPRSTEDELTLVWLERASLSLHRRDIPKNCTEKARVHTLLVSEIKATFDTLRCG
ncbi:hypothetical protein, partial [Delftia acidovorans]|uniref:hypothetical protein n=1 Tax=Delftia acidovorans TaxID=80866 RepID=UPI0035A12ACF